MAHRLLFAWFVLPLSLCAASLEQKDDIHFTPVDIKQRTDGFISLSCQFGMIGPEIEYVVIGGMNKVSERSHGYGEADSSSVEVFVGGKWRSVPDQRVCGTGLGLYHFVPEIYQTLSFGVARHSELRALVARFGNPDDGVLVRAAFSLDIVRSKPRRVEEFFVRSAVCFVRIGSSGIQTPLPTLYTPENDAEAQDLLDRIREQWPNQISEVNKQVKK